VEVTQIVLLINEYFCLIFFDAGGFPKIPKEFQAIKYISHEYIFLLFSMPFCTNKPFIISQDFV